MSEMKVYDVPATIAAHAHITYERYIRHYERSLSDPEGFWGEHAQRFVDWMQPGTKSVTGITTKVRSGGSRVANATLPTTVSIVT
jgi:hypothetical protein